MIEVTTTSGTTVEANATGNTIEVITFTGDIIEVTISNAVAIPISLLPRIEDDYASDADAATAGIEVGQAYHRSGIQMIRLI